MQTGVVSERAPPRMPSLCHLPDLVARVFVLDVYQHAARQEQHAEHGNERHSHRVAGAVVAKLVHAAIYGTCHAMAETFQRRRHRVLDRFNVGDWGRTTWCGCVFAATMVVGVGIGRWIRCDRLPTVRMSSLRRGSMPGRDFTHAST